MNPDTNQFEPVTKNDLGELRRADGDPVPGDWPVFKLGETLVIRRYRWRVASMQGSQLTLVGEGPLVVKPPRRSSTERNRDKRRRKRHGGSR